MDCEFYDDLGVSAGKVDMRSLQVRLKKDIKTERRGAGRRTANFAMISVYRRARSIPVGISCPTIAESAQKRRPTSVPLPPY